jgi:uncharacterized phage protein gp47/JayE
MDYTLTVTQAKNRLRNNTDLTYLDSGSVAGGILETQVSLSNDISSSIYRDVTSQQLGAATGSDLDGIGKFLGISRRPSTLNVGEVTISIKSTAGMDFQRLIDFINEKTGDGLDRIPIPLQTIFTNAEQTVQYISQEMVSITSDDPINIQVMSYSSGETSQVGAGELISIMNPTATMLYLNDYIEITNTQAIANGESEETDDNYRSRLSVWYQANKNANDVAIRSAILAVPGVANVYITKYKNGIGTTDAMIISEAPIVTDSLVSSVQNMVDQVKSSSETITISKPNYVGLTFNIIISYSSDTDSGQKESTSKGIQDSIVSYINTLSLGETFSYSHMQRIINSDESIKSYSIDRSARGTYNVETGYIDDLDPIVLIDQEIDLFSKFIANTETITVCYN